MMAIVKATNGKADYQIELQSATGNIIVADEPQTKGGQDTGFSPKELLASALAACTSATVRMYAGRKEWNLADVQVEVALTEEAGSTIFERKIHFEGRLDEEQRNRLLAVANACHVHKILSNPIVIPTQII